MRTLLWAVFGWFWGQFILSCVVFYFNPKELKEFMWLEYVNGVGSFIFILWSWYWLCQ